MSTVLVIFIVKIVICSASRLFYDDMSDYKKNWESRGSVTTYNGDGGYCTSNPCTILKLNGTYIERTFSANNKYDLMLKFDIRVEIDYKRWNDYIGLQRVCNDEDVYDVFLTSDYNGRYLYGMESHLASECDNCGKIKIRFYLQFQDDNDHENALYVDNFYFCDNSDCDDPKENTGIEWGKLWYILIIVAVIGCVVIGICFKYKAIKHSIVPNNKQNEENIDKTVLVQNDQIQIQNIESIETVKTMEIETNEEKATEPQQWQPSQPGLISKAHFKNLSKKPRKRQGIMTSSRWEAMQNNDKIVKEHPEWFYEKEHESEPEIDAVPETGSNASMNTKAIRSNANNSVVKQQKMNKQQIIQRIRSNLPRVPNTQLMCKRCGQTWRNANRDGHKLRNEHVKHCRHDWNCAICGKTYIDMRFYVNHVKSCTNLQ